MNEPMPNPHSSRGFCADVLVGSIWSDQYGEARVMAFAEGYALMRRPRCIPFIEKASVLNANQRWQKVSDYKLPRCKP